MRMQEQRTSPNRRLGKRSTCVRCPDVSNHDAVSRERIQIGSESRLGVVSAEIIRPHRIDHKQKNVRAPFFDRNKRIHQLEVKARLRASNFRVFAKHLAELSAWFALAPVS